ncbi:AB hydrolase superfamily protein [Cyphellophora attinorum]|uniref:AB hydrolase superfamily protein n=1 Tax=Cyphellophora attinorum TaxID=1664694 RepID=A0A0N1P3C7_9EURO|nr:AB hydrolase superfamily protein [Phialophora attinorum]KPI45194.1 AB hydrolase superfamily protein [Phialophora attinorum]
MARPRPPKPAYKRSMVTDTVPVDLYFYLPPKYYYTLRSDPHHRFPCVVNFHGGGFSLGDPRDDRYWARVVLEQTDAVFVSVGYRRAPEHPFPTAVDDSADALLYLSDHAEDLHIDPTKLALTGFSAGANLVFSVPLRLAYHRRIKATVSQVPFIPSFAPNYNLEQLGVQQIDSGTSNRNLSVNHFNNDSNNHLSAFDSHDQHPPFHSPFDTPSPSVSRVTTRHDDGDSSPTDHDDYQYDDHNPPDEHNRHHTHQSHSEDDEHVPPDTPLHPPPTISYDFAETPSLKRPHHPGRSTTSLMLMRTNTGHPLRITSIIAWYPLLDWTVSRASKKRNSLNPPKCLPKTFTDLFDHAYLPPPDPAGAHASPYASPGLAPDHMLTEALPPDIQLWLCEWDMLLKEGQTFSQRLKSLGKNVDSKLVPRVPHGFDKSPNPFRDQAAIDALYEKAAKGLAQVFSNEYGGLHSSASSIQESLVDRAPRRSVVPAFG